MKTVLNAEMSSWYDLLTSTEKGILELPTLAKEKGMKITLEGKEVFPESFNECGEPIFSEEFAELMDFKKEEVKRGINKNKNSILFNVTYNERSIIPSDNFDTIEGIEKYITCLDDIHSLLKVRKMYLKENPENKLNQFVIFGKYLLNKFGDLDRLTFFNPFESPIICTEKEFLHMVGSYHRQHKVHIPKDNTICPICSQKFTIEDMKDSEFDLINGKICHESCKEEYYKKKNTWHIVKDIMEYIYPNCAYESLEHSPVYANPALLFKTDDGDIRIRRLGSEYYIEWQSNFKEFKLGPKHNIHSELDNTHPEWEEPKYKRSISVSTANDALNILQLAHLYNI
ncbi:MAG: hypothetical protein E7311_01315 [Clostridiales bacterium]|nr:hypothetical protein [Clostridiales bacterium]